ncbi:hypothetical protein OHA74_54125 [Streptomyces phaeochromogenes]|uniref:hypothetical protein n=1 Tax=Streptomyces phaeochromogenes TaxID=1923 RepID=UPI002E2AC379|nr:hypothetical protein [Streptomyces phaeochromogenes]
MEPGRPPTAQTVCPAVVRSNGTSAATLRASIAAALVESHAVVTSGAEAARTLVGKVADEHRIAPGRGAEQHPVTGQSA